jgi:hypothetical protein
MIRKRIAGNEDRQLRTMVSNKSEELALQIITDFQVTVAGRPVLSFDVMREVIINELVRLHFEKIQKRYHAGRVTEQLVLKCGLPYNILEIVEIYIK